MDRKRTHLILFTSNFPYGKGEQFIELEILYLAKEFDVISIIPYSYGFNKNARSVPSNVKVYSPLKPEGFSPIKLFFKGVLNLTPLDIFFKELFEKNFFGLRLNSLIIWLRHSLIIRMLAANKSLKGLINNPNNKTVVYFYWGRIHSAIIPFIDKKIPSIVKFHGGDLYEERIENNGYIPFRKAVLRFLNTAVFISDDGKKYLENKYPDIPFKSKIFRLGVKYHGNSKHSYDNHLKIVSCSSFKKLKRVHILAEALNFIDFPVIWTHIGDGPERGMIETIVKNLPDNIKVHFMGQITNVLVSDYYLNNPVDLFINTSEYEGVPVSIMEALSFSIPVFGPAVGGIPELIDSNVGRLLPLDITSIQLAGFLKEFYNTPIHLKIEKRHQAFERWNKLANADNNYNDFALFLKSLI